MFTWQKLGKVFTPQEVEGRSWLREFAQAPAALVCDDFVRVYFSCRDRADLFQIRNVAAQPILSLGGLGEFDEFGTYPCRYPRRRGSHWQMTGSRG